MDFRSQLLAGIFACALSLSAFALEPIKIGVTGPFTGSSSSMGVSMRDGVRLAIEEINKKAAC
jgi:branched-chain amino acid transport system substrate-binding protein